MKIANFERGFENINEQMADMREALEKYPDYKPGGTNIVYHEPENEKQLEIAKKVMRRNLGFMVIFTLAFVAFFSPPLFVYFLPILISICVPK